MAWLSLGRGPVPSWGSYTSPESPSKAAPKGEAAGASGKRGVCWAAWKSTGVGLGKGVGGHFSTDCKLNKKHKQPPTVWFYGQMMCDFTN